MNRVQRKRTKGWKMPSDTISVTRPGPFGNPFKVKDAAEAGYGDGRQMAVHAFRRWLAGDTDYMHPGRTHPDRDFILANMGALRGKNLACYCALCDQHKDGKPFNVTCADCVPCHSDVLGTIANNFECVEAA